MHHSTTNQVASIDKAAITRKINDAWPAIETIRSNPLSLPGVGVKVLPDETLTQVTATRPEGYPVPRK